MTLLTDRDYLKGAVKARDFLRRTQEDIRQHRHFEPKSLRWEYQIQIQDKPAEYQAGFLDGIGAYVLTALGDALVDLYRWEILRVLEDASKKK